jgi:hypothetical protein
MEVAMILGHVGAWNEADYFALGETADRIELVDGTLLVAPVESPRHQRLAGALVAELHAPAAAVGLSAYRAVNVRLRPGRIVIPDLVVSDYADSDDLVVDASAVALVGEVVPAGEAAVERLFKAHLYAAAGIRWYLLAQLISPTSVKVQLMRLVRLDGGIYVEHLTAAGGRRLGADSPFPFIIDTGALLSR